MNVGDLLKDDFLGFGLVVRIEAADLEEQAEGTENIAMIHFFTVPPRFYNRGLRRWSVDSGLEGIVVSAAPGVIEGPRHENE